MQRIQALLQLVLLSLGSVKAFAPQTPFAVSSTSIHNSRQETHALFTMQEDEDGDSITDNKIDTGVVSRRDWGRRTTVAALAVLTSTSINLLTNTSPAMASGGATAGGVYLLSAKQRYNARVTAGIKTFLSLETSLTSSSLEETKTFFTSDDEGQWKDSAAAGYLLANAFRRSSSTPPDNLPSVKKWKAFAGELDVLQKALKKKDVKGVTASYNKALDLLDAYLEAVELPPVIDLRQSWSWFLVY